MLFDVKRGNQSLLSLVSPFFHGGGFMKRIFGLFKMFRRDIVVMLLAVFHKDTPKKVRGLMLMAILYLLSPIDILPDSIPLMGVVDDMVIVPTAVYGLMKLLPVHVRQSSEDKASYVIRHGAAVVLAASGVVILWLGLVIWGIYTLFFK